MYSFWLVLLVATLIAAYWGGLGSSRSGGASNVMRALTVGGHEFAVEVRDTALGRAEGLSGRELLAEDTGMLFIFETPGIYGFWMKDMKFPIDIVWIEGERVVGIIENVVPEPEKSIFTLTVYRPPEPVSRVLELPAGTVARYGLRTGDAVR